jgi:TetR/AcrR family transcriptional regulator
VKDDAARAESEGTGAAGLSFSLPPRRERNAQETRKRLLDAAEAEFAAKGFDGARLGSIARASGVQQALIHHYFDDKAGLYHEVIGRGLGGITREGWDILARTLPPHGSRRKRMAPDDVRELVVAFVELLVRFYSSNARLLAILRHDAHGGGSATAKIVEEYGRPQFDAIVHLLEEMRKRREVRRDVDPKHFVISVVAMACFPFQEPAFMRAAFGIDVSLASFQERRKAEIVETALSRLLP